MKMNDFGMTMIMGVEFDKVVPYTHTEYVVSTDGKTYAIEYKLVNIREVEEDK